MYFNTNRNHETTILKGYTRELATAPIVAENKRSTDPPASDP